MGLEDEVVTVSKKSEASTLKDEAAAVSEKSEASTLKAKAPALSEKSPADREDHWDRTRKSFLTRITVLGFALQLLFLADMSYLYGSLWGSNIRYHHFKVLWMDLDGGVISQAAGQAYRTLQGPSFPSLIVDNSPDLRSVEAALVAVRDGSYWAAVVVNANASTRLADALEGGLAAQTYQATDAMTYIWNEVRYPPFSDEAFVSNFEALAETAKQIYLRQNGQSVLANLDQSDDAALQVLFNPIDISSVNIMPTTNPTRLMYNTATMVMPILQAFFFILLLNGLSEHLHIYSKVPVRMSGLVRVTLSLAYTFIAALCTTGYIWAFRESWAVNSNQFVLSWMTLWLLGQVHFWLIDSATAFLPPPSLPFFLLTWILINISSTISPPQISARFYHLSYAMPANEAYTVLTDIWSGASVPALYRALPILFSWLVAGSGLAVFGHFYRCRVAHEKVAAALRRDNRH